MSFIYIKQISFRRLCNNVLLLLTFLYCEDITATHNRAGEITYVQIGELTIRVTITTYTKTSSILADRDSLEIFWGDGTSSIVGRANGFGDIMPNDIKRNYYISEHTYPGRATYTIHMSDPNRIGGILNVNFPNSIKIPFHIETTFTFINSQFQGENNSAILLQPPIDFGCVGQPFIHNPNAYDPDGDSLSYELIIPFQDVNSLVPNYLFPNQIAPGPNNQIFLDEKTGDFIWTSPQKVGEYNVAIKIYEYRQGVLINTIIRDFQILIQDCQNEPPDIETIDEICVVAGEQVSFQVTARDPDIPNQKLELTALGGPMEHNVAPAMFIAPAGFQEQPVTGIFSWNTQCEHISNQYYAVVFKAVDNFFDTTGLATLKTVRIKVVGPPPENVRSVNNESRNQIFWDKPYICEQTEDNYFRGFTVWRKENPSQFPVDSCNPGLAGKGYMQIAYSVKTFEGDSYTYIDQNAQRGKSYCYRVTGTFAKLSAAGNPFNIVESIPSNEDCAGLAVDLPYLTKVSVIKTDLSDGIIQVEWTKPNLLEFDTLRYPGPYRFVVTRATGMVSSGFQPVPTGEFVSQTFLGAVDTTFTDMSGLNTVVNSYSYQIAFYAGNNNTPHKVSLPAASVFLHVQGSDKRNIISWETMVPWDNYSFKIFRKSEGELVFSEVGSTIENSYVDLGLENGTEYCYYIETEGSYGFSKLPEPLTNLSQFTCEKPQDNVPPCPPELKVTNSCDESNVFSPGIFTNRLSWTMFHENCLNPSDVSGFNVYYAPTINSNYDLLESIIGATQTTFQHGSEFGLSGCYAVTSLDSLDNESPFSNQVCVENCPFFSLPNTFTPNGDGFNDLFISYPYKFVDQIEFTVYNRWGEIVFKTTEPAINWNGTNLGGKDLAEGVYYYICRVFEQRIEGVVENPAPLTGYIELIR